MKKLSLPSWAHDDSLSIKKSAHQLDCSFLYPLAAAAVATVYLIINTFCVEGKRERDTYNVVEKKQKPVSRSEKARFHHWNGRFFFVFLFKKCSGIESGRAEDWWGSRCLPPSSCVYIRGEEGLCREWLDQIEQKGDRTVTRIWLCFFFFFFFFFFSPFPQQTESNQNKFLSRRRRPSHCWGENNEPKHTLALCRLFFIF